MVNEQVCVCQENKMFKIFWCFEIQVDPSIQSWWPDLALINEKKRTYQPVDFVVSV